MRTKIAILCGLLMAAPLLHAAGPENSRFYVTPSVEYMFMGNLKLDDAYAFPNRDLKFKGTAGLSLETGFHLTPKHVLKFETGYFKTETKASPYPLTTSLYAPTTADLEIVPLLIGYKYCHNINDKWQLHAGISEGVTMLRTQVKLNFLGTSVPGYTAAPSIFTRNDTNYAFTAGGEVGVDYNLTERSKLNLEVKCRAITSTDSTTRGVTTSVNLGYKFKF